jgi:hypothetical protein
MGRIQQGRAVPRGGEERPLYFSGTGPGCYAVLVAHWKLMVYGDDRRLFNLGNDPGELTDVSRRFPDTAARLADFGLRIMAENMSHRKTIEISARARDKQDAEKQEIKTTMRSLGYVR